ncbi:MAG TPA: rod shape-determining protein MreD [Opitutaceae bacterium]|jgi:rod shape-determining protein MreD
MRPAAVLFLTLYILRALVGEANSMLSGLHVWLFAGGLFVTYAALAMPFRPGFAASLLGGLLCDALSPVAFGTHAALFAAAHAVVYNARERLQRDETGVRVAVAAIVNAALFVAMSFLALRSTHGAASWPRMISDLAWSEAAVAALAPWFFSLQLRTLELARALPER